MASIATLYPPPPPTGSSISETTNLRTENDSDSSSWPPKSEFLQSRVTSINPTESTKQSFQRRRSSAFTEVGLQGNDAIIDARLRRNSRPKLQVRFRSKVDVLEPEVIWSQDPYEEIQEMPPYFPTLPRLLFLAFVVALILPSLGHSPFLKAGITPIGAKAGPVHVKQPKERRSIPPPVKRQNDPTNICKRWSGQSALVNGTLYYYGGRLTTSATQTSNEWSMYIEQYGNAILTHTQTMT